MARTSPVVAQTGSVLDRSWRVALARAARDAMTLGLEVKLLDHHTSSLAELLEMPVAHSMIAVLDGPQGGLGLMAISPPLLAAMTEMQTIGRVSVMMPPPRKPTRTDAAMVAGFIDMALGGLEASLADEADLVWAGGFRYASFLHDPRPLGLLLEDVPYRVQLADISIENGARMGQILLALPAHGCGARPVPVVANSAPIDPTRSFAADLMDQVDASGCVLQAVLHRMTLPLSTVMGFQLDDLLPLEFASVDRVMIAGLDGQIIASGKLGQNRGMCAVRLTPPAAAVMLDQDPPGDIIDVPKIMQA